MYKLSKQSEFFNDFKFVLAARSLDPIKPVFNHVFVDDDAIVCTDSRRLHMLTKDIRETTGLDNGFYEVVKETKSQIWLDKAEVAGDFPNYKQVIPDIEKNDYLISEWEVQPITSNSRSISNFFTGFFKKFAKQIILNIDFLKPLNDHFSIYASEPMSPVLFVNETKKAVLMPIQV